MSVEKPTTIYGRGDEDKKKEFFEEDEELCSKLDHLAEWIRESRHCIFFTGAGISTSTGIPDFRSGMNTVLETGPGAWELRDNNMKRDKKSKVKQVLKAVPSATHMGIVQLQEEGYVKFVVSQNTDGLHLRSGLDPSSLAELHGNTNLESCTKCNRKYLRDFSTRSGLHVRDHETGRLCADAKCMGKLVDSIVNFGESLPEIDLDKSFSHAEKADLCICMGSSLTVSPANDIPERVADRNERLVICNLQRTPLHDKCSMAIHAMCDDIMKGLMERIKLPPKVWELKRRVRVTFNTSSSGIVFKIVGLDVTRNLPYSLFQQVVLTHKTGKTPITLRKEPFTSTLLFPSAGNMLNIEMSFHGHYSEPPVSIKTKILNEKSKQDFIMTYDLYERKWEVNMKN